MRCRCRTWARCRWVDVDDFAFRKASDYGSIIDAPLPLDLLVPLVVDPIAALAQFVGHVL